MTGEPLSGEIFPGGIAAFDQADLLHSAPALELLLAVNCLRHVVERFVIHQPMASILFGKALNEPILVFEHSSAQVVRHPDVDHARLAADDVYAIANDLSLTIPEKQVPRLRIPIGFANCNATLGMTSCRLKQRKLCRTVTILGT